MNKLEAYQLFQDVLWMDWKPDDYLDYFIEMEYDRYGVEVSRDCRYSKIFMLCVQCFKRMEEFLNEEQNKQNY